MWPKTGVFDRTDGLGFGFRPELLGSVASIITQDNRIGGSAIGNGNFSWISRYLTRKGSNVDSSIQWSSSSLSKETRKRNMDYANQDTLFQDSAEMPGVRNTGKLRRTATCSYVEIDIMERSDDLLRSQLDVTSSFAFNVRDRPAFIAKVPHWSDKTDVSGQASCSSLPSEDPHSSFAPESSCDLSSINSILNSINALASISNTNSMKLHTSSGRSSIQLRSCVVPLATVLLIDIKDFTSKCASLPAGRVGQSVAAFYRLVDAAAAAHGVRKVEVRGDCCLCVAGVCDALPPDPRVQGPVAADNPANQATRMLAFAAALHADLKLLPSGDGISTMVSMRIATGEVKFLINQARDTAEAFASMQGDTVALAAQMEALAGHGAVYVHRSTADRWAMEGRHPPAATMLVGQEGRGHGQQRAAVYDCATRAFAPWPDTPAKRLRRASSAAF